MADVRVETMRGCRGAARRDVDDHVASPTADPSAVGVDLRTPDEGVDAALIVAGGRSSRLGVDKPEQVVGGRRLLDAALDAVAGVPTVVVGPDRRVPPSVRVVRESPAGSGPLAAIAAGVAALPGDAASVAVLAADLPDVDRQTVARLARLRATTGSAVALAEDHDGRAQFLLSVWDAAALRTALGATAELADAPVRAIVPDGAPRLRLHTTDVDTPDDLRRAQLSPLSARRCVRLGLAPLRVTVGPARTGAVLAEAVCAAAPFPPFDQSAMDGWAVAGSGPWAAVDRPVHAGRTPPPLRHGTAVRIGTGAKLPAGADRVIRDEEVTVRDGWVTGDDAARDDVRRRGSAWPAGALLAPAGTVVDWALAATLTAAAVEHAATRGPVQIRVHTSGDEIGAVGGAGLPETAAAPVSEVLTRGGAVITPGAHLADRPAAFATALTSGGAANDVVVIIGATGRGIADPLRTSLHRAGAQTLVDGVDLRPGGSLLVAVLPDGRVVLGLPGNPMAAVAGAALLGRAVCNALLDAAAEPVEFVTLASAPLDDRWRISPAVPDGAGRWRCPDTVATGHLLDAVGSRAVLLLPPRSRAGDLAQRLA